MGNANYRELGAAGDPGDWVAVFISETVRECGEREGRGGCPLTYKESSGNILIYEAVIKLF